MDCATRKLRSPLKWHGGKSYLARRIVALFPAHRVYLEPYLGGGSVLLNKLPAGREVAGDVDADLVRFWATMRDDPDFPAILDDRPYTAATFDAAAGWRDGRSPRDRAAGFLIRNRFSRGGLGRDFAWSERK